MKFRSLIPVALIAFAAALHMFSSRAGAHPAPQQDNGEGEDRLVRLMSASKVKAMEIDGKPFRRAEGPARFLHNDTYLVCDTAIWDVDAQVIYAIGHVSIEQERTELISDRLTYRADISTAEFRGNLVQLRDSDGNTLRTRNLDYNTKDSVAVFRSGGAMRDKDGQIIESLEGTYDSKARLFTFRDEVNMFSDSVFVKTSFLDYASDSSLATYPEYVEVWNGDNMLSGRSGWYNRKKEVFFFKDDVHLMSPTQEGWCDSLLFYRALRNIDMLGNAQLMDTTRGVTSLSGRIFYLDTLSRVTLSRDPVVIMKVDEKTDSTTRTDSVYVRADTMIYWTVIRGDVPNEMIETAAKRIVQVNTDAVANIRAKAAEEAAKALEEARKNDPNYRPPVDENAPGGEDSPAGENAPAKPDNSAPKDVAADSSAAVTPAADSLHTAVDSLRTAADSLAVTDSVPPVKDSTKIGFARAYGNVKMFRRTMQMTCDSLVYSDLDSLARMFKDPIIWNERTHQYNCDSLWAVVKDDRFTKAYLQSNAFIHINEDDIHFDQIRSTEILAHFDSLTQLSRFDAMGTATGIFYLKEKEKIGTANRKEATILSADFKDGTISKISYFENPKSDAFPVAQMKKGDMFLKGYNWQPDKRPRGPWEFTDRILRHSQRSHYASRPRAGFARTEQFFSGYMDGIYREIERSDSLRRVRERERERLKDAKPLLTDTLSLAKDSLSVGADSLAGAPKDTTALADTTANTIRDAVADSLAQAAADSTKAYMDSLFKADPKKYGILVKKQERQKARQERLAAMEKKRAEREAARLARWEELDARDAAALAKKEAGKKARQRARQEKQWQRMMQRKAAEDALYEKYKQKYLNKFNLTPTVQPSSDQ